MGMQWGAKWIASPQDALDRRPRRDPRLGERATKGGLFSGTPASGLAAARGCWPDERD